MQASFWVMTLLMMVMSLVFVLTPLARANQRRASVLVAIALPAFAMSFYVAIGSPDVQSATAHAAADTGPSTSAGSVSSLTAGLEARLSEQPGDGEGWLLLAKSYVYLNRMDEARHAYARAVDLGETDATVAQQVAGDDATSGSGIAGSVSLSPAAARLVAPDDSVFIFARPPGEAGAPVAVVRKTAGTWPLEFRLTDAQAMAGGMRLSDHEKVIVTARISRRGDANAAPRRLEARSQPIDVANEAVVHLTID